jgi:hypothetical protein
LLHFRRYAPGFGVDQLGEHVYVLGCPVGCYGGICQRACPGEYYQDCQQ